MAADLERPPGKIDLLNGLVEDAGTESHGLGAEVGRQLEAGHAAGEAGEILDVRGRGELPASGDPPCHEPLEHDRCQVGARCVDGRRMPGRA